MTRSLRLGLLLLAAALVARPLAWPTPAQDFCPLREVRPGQVAVAKSVFRGTQIESFHLKIIGVLHKFDGTRSIILARILDGPIITRKSGVIAGMSGSPVYINGRLAGAIALTWPWSKEPVAGITPIEEMLAAWREKPVEKAAAPAAGGLASPLRLEGKTINRVRMSPGLPEAPDPPGLMTLVPLGGFVQASGFNARSIECAAGALAPYGLHVMQGPAGGGEERLRPPLLPGASLGIKLVTGDFDMTALGTLTLVEGDKILGFGHPLLQRGEVDLPMTGGYVHDILPCLDISSKIMAPTQVVGRIYRDHQSAVAGEIGARSDLLPVSIEVTDRDVSRSRKFQVEVVRVRELMPALVASSVITAIDETRGRVARGTARVSLEIEAEGRPALRREEFAYSEADAAAAASPFILDPLRVFTDNPFGQLRLQRVRARIETHEPRPTASIERVTLARSRVQAGDEVTLMVTIRPYGEDLVVVPAKLSLPPDLPRGQVRIVVSGGTDAQEARTAIGAPRPAPTSLSQLIERYLSWEQSSDLVVQASLTRRGVSLLGEELPDLPAAALEALRASHPTDLRPLPSLLKVVQPTKWILTGRQVTALQVESPIAPGPPGPKPPPEEAPDEREEEAASSRPLPPIPVGEAVLTWPPGTQVATSPSPGKPETSAEQEKEAKPLRRAPQVWQQATAADYEDAKLRSVAIAEDGSLRLAPEPADLAQIPADVVWSVALRDGTAYVGTGSDGLIYRVSEKGELSQFFATGEMNVHALACDKDGNLCAATSPRGKLFRISPDGAGKAVFDSDSTYLWSLAMGPQGTIYAGGGPPARIYEIPPDGRARVLVELPATNVLSLVCSRSGDLYAGTSDSGIVYRVGPDGTARAICQVTGESADALALDEHGNLFASATPGGEIYRFPPDGPPALYCDTKQQTIHGLALLPNGDLLAATGPDGLLLRIGSDGQPEVMFRPETGLATAVARGEARPPVGGAIYLGSSAPSVLRKFGPGQATSGSLESKVLDAERAARWGRIEWAAAAPEGTEVKAETRSGDSPDPDDHWSPWVPAADGSIVSPPARYLQYRLTLTTNNSEISPLVRQVRVSYQAQNRRPTCLLKQPGPGDRLAKRTTIEWQARDPDKDTLTYEVAVSSDLGRTWSSLKQDLQEPKYEWDTTKQSDGRYLLRVTASDSLSVPGEPERAEAVVAVWADNTPPQVLLFRSSLAVGADRRAQVSGLASDALSPIRSVEYRVDEGTWRSLPLASIEAAITDFHITTDALEPGEHKLEVRAFDAARNLASDSMTVTVEKKEAAPAAAAAAPADRDGTPVGVGQ